MKSLIRASKILIQSLKNVSTLTLKQSSRYSAVIKIFFSSNELKPSFVKHKQISSSRARVDNFPYSFNLTNRQ